MSTPVRVFQVDAFTSLRFAGNPAGVVLDADALSATDMQQLARELGNADTAFLLRPDAADHDVRVRFFTPLREVAFVGHATLAAHAVLARLGLPPRPRQQQAQLLVQVDRIGEAQPPRIAIHQPPPQGRRDLTAAEVDAVLAALALNRTDLDPRCPPAVLGTGSTRLLLGLTEGAALARAKPDTARLVQLSATLGAPGYFLFSLRPTVADVFTESRMFCPALGINEDPVSGNAHGLLALYLLQQQLLRPGIPTPGPTDGAVASETLEFTGAQGHHLGRPGRVTVALDLLDGVPIGVSIIGEAVVVFETSLAF